MICSEWSKLTHPEMERNKNSLLLSVDRDVDVPFAEFGDRESMLESQNGGRSLVSL